MADNLFFDPELNPVIFYDDDRAVTDQFQTPHFEDFPFDERGQAWLQSHPFSRVWQTTDIIEGQFTAQFSDIIISLLNSDNEEVITLPALIGLPNLDYPGTWIFEYSMSLAGLLPGCYRMKRTLGNGSVQKVHRTDWMYIDDVIPGTIFIKYWHDRFYKDVVFESGKKFGIRVFGWIDYDRQGRKYKQEKYRDDRNNPTMLNSKSAKNIPLYIGDEFGSPVDLNNIIELAFECNNIEIDNKPFGLAEDANIEYIDIEGYRLRGLHTMIEPGINRYSRISSVATDTTKKLNWSMMASAHLFGSLGDNSSTNTVPINFME